jgi:hypothetical protein
MDPKLRYPAVQRKLTVLVVLLFLRSATLAGCTFLLSKQRLLSLLGSDLVLRAFRVGDNVLWHVLRCCCKDYFIPGENSVLATDWSPDAAADAVLSLLRDDAQRARLGHNARAFALRYLASSVTAPRVAAAFV